MLDNPCFGYIDDIGGITLQYFDDLDLHFFGHISVYPDGKFSFLCSRHEWPEDHFVQKKIPPVGFTLYDHITDRVLFPSMDKGSDFGWTDEVTIESKERFGILNPMLITRKYHDHYEGFFFDLHGENVYEKYVNNFDVFERFIHYHKDKSKKLIEKVGDHRLLVDDKYIPLKSKNLETPNVQKHKIQPKRYYLRHNGIEIVVSAREYNCLSRLSHGWQFKSIARDLKVSTRTIETYCNSIKKKFNLTSRKDISDVYWSNKFFFVEE